MWVTADLPTPGQCVDVASEMLEDHEFQIAALESSPSHECHAASTTTRPSPSNTLLMPSPRESAKLTNFPIIQQLMVTLAVQFTIAMQRHAKQHAVLVRCVCRRDG